MSLKILIVKTSALGDIVHAMPVLEYLKEKHGNVQIDWVVEKGGASLVKAHPHVRKILVLDSKQWKKSIFKQRKAVFDFIKDLREEEYDIVFDFQSNIKSGFITALAKAKKKVGFGRKTVHEWPNLLATNTHFNPSQDKNIYERNLFLVQKIFGDEGSWKLKPRLLLTPESPNLSSQSTNRYMLCFGSRWETKKVSSLIWREMLQRITNEGDEVYIVYGSETEKNEAEMIGAGLKGIHFLPPMTLPLWQNTMSLMTGILAVDSVGLHLAGYAGVPTFSIFGASSAKVFGPSGLNHASMQGTCPYGMTFDKRCPKLRSCSTGACIKELSVEQIWPHFVEWKSKCQSRYASLRDLQPL
jgi:heptosyltransferase-1